MRFRLAIWKQLSYLLYKLEVLIRGGGLLSSALVAPVQSLPTIAELQVESHDS